MVQFDFMHARVNESGELCIDVVNKPAARQFVLRMRERAYTCEIKAYRKKRSLDTNAYFWVLCGKLAEATSQPKEQIYRESIRNIGGNSDTVCVIASAVNKLCESWHRNGLGWITESFQSKIPGCRNVTLYYGSSTYDGAQMARLIDNIVQDCRAVGIETLTPAELDALKDDWAR